MTYSKQELDKFLIALDSELESDHSIIVIGGAAATLHYNSKGGTVDIDTYDSMEALREAYNRTKAKHPELQIPLGAAAPAQAPIDFKKRLQAYTQLPLKHLKVQVPEAHDWVLLKAARSDDKDITDIQELAKRVVIEADILLDRFKTEVLPHNGANDELLIAGYLYVISVLFGEKTADAHQIEIKKSANL